MVDGDIHGVFAYPNGNAERVKDLLFNELTNSTTLSERVENRSIACTENQNLLFSIDAPEYRPSASESITISPPISCIVLERPEGGVKYAEEPGRDEYVDLFAEIYKHLPEQPAAGYVMGGDQSSGVMNETAHYYHPVTADCLADGEFNDAAWVMIFPPAMVETYGEDTLRDLPVRRFEKLDDGSVVTVADGDPTEYTEWRDVAVALDIPGATDRPH